MPKNIEDIKPPKKEPSAFFLELSKAKAGAVGKEEVKKPEASSATKRTVEVPPKPIQQPTVVEEVEYSSRVMPNSPVSSPIVRRTTHIRFMFRKRVWISALIAVLGLAAVLSFVFAGGKVIITPKTLDFNLNATFTASKDSVTNLSFQIMSIDDGTTVAVPKSGSVVTPTKATGSVILYNEYSSKPQSLLINTRLTRPDGKIYFTDKAVTIPGDTTSGGTITPGSIEVTITAEKAGEDYNSDPTDFKILGFKGLPKYDKIYGRSNTALIGGSSEPQNTITPAEASTAYEQVKGSLRTTLLAKARAQVPADFILYDDGAFVSTTSTTPETTSTLDTIPVTAQGTLTAIIFSRAALTKAILEDKLKTPIDPNDVVISNLESLTLKFQNKELIDPRNTTTVTFTLLGDPHADWIVDETKVQEALVGKSKSEVGSILETFPGIEHARVVIRPFWNTKLPSTADQIKVEIEHGDQTIPVDDEI